MKKTISFKLEGVWSPYFTFETFQKLMPDFEEVEAVSIREEVTYEEAEEIKKALT